MVRDRNFIYGIFVGLTLALIIFICVQQTTSQHASTSFAYVDMEEVTKAVSNKILAQNLNNEESTKQIEALREQFDLLVSEYSKQHNKVLYSQPRPLKGAKDVTAELLKDLFKTNANFIRG